MTASLNGKRDSIPLRELDTAQIDVPLDAPKVEDPQASVDRTVYRELAVLRSTLEQLRAQLDAKRRPLVPPPANFGEWLRWAAFLWLVAYGIIVLVQLITS